MYLAQQLPDGTSAGIVVRKSAKERLATTCFRGAGVSKAGNFSAWESAEKLFGTYGVTARLLAHLAELWVKRDFDTHSVEIELPSRIGWGSTDHLMNYRPEELEEFKPNSRSTALRVKPSLKHLTAAQTHCLTVVFELKMERGHPVAVIHSVYPGRDIGELEGDVTEREQIVFFDWDHPGE